MKRPLSKAAETAKVAEIIGMPDTSPDDDEDAGAPLITRVTVEWQQQRLDRVLAQWQPEQSRSHLQALVEEGAVTLDGQVCRQASRKLRLGQSLSLALRPPASSQAFVAEAMALPIVHEDETLLVIDKPAGLVVHPAAGNWTGTLMNGLLAHHALAVQLPRAGIVHRLDKDTSGLMVVAKTPAAYADLVAQLAARSVRRDYLAVCKGAWGEPRSIEVPIGRDPKSRVRMAVVSEAQGGKAARTDVSPLAQTKQASLLHCRLHTGRTHQIRVHCAHAGHPLVGDATYGGPPGLPRQALHAARLRLVHPASGAAMDWQAAPPADLSALLAHWGWGVPTLA
jgi:23S rRNA pseudouridine1911/1915/1917 synthase